MPDLTDQIIPDPPPPQSWTIHTGSVEHPELEHSWTDVVSWGHQDGVLSFGLATGVVELLPIERYDVVTIVPVHPSA